MGCKLSLDPPDEIRCGETKLRVGGLVWRAIKCVTEQGTVELRQFTKAIWGEKETKRATVRQLIFRVNTLLDGLRYPQRLLLDKDTVSLS